MRVTAEGPGSPAPNLLNACTANVYEAPSESPDTRQVKVVVAQERPPGLAFTMYFVTINPPVDTGGCHATVALPRTTLTLTTLGFPGPAMRRATADGADTALQPTSLRAATVNV